MYFKISVTSSTLGLLNVNFKFSVNDVEENKINFSNLVSELFKWPMDKHVHRGAFAPKEY